MKHYIVEENPLSHLLFNNTKLAWFWLVVRLYVGYEWLSAGWEKLHDQTWTGAQAGTALGGFLNGAVAKTTGLHPDVQSWYAWFLEHTVMNHLGLWLLTFFVLLPLATTMALIWKTKETILDSVFDAK